MDVSNPRSRIGGSRGSQLLSSRRGALIVAIVAALAAGALFYLFAQNYRSSAPTVLPPQNVLVALKQIPQGAAGQVIASEGLLKTIQVPGSRVVPGAIGSLSAISGQVTTASIAPGQQLTVADFTHANISISSYLTGDQRAISLPLDAAHGITAFLQQGDAVDIMRTSAKGTTLLAQNISVLSNAGGQVVLRVTDKQALAVADSADNSKVWLSMRPLVQAQQSIPVGATSAASH